MDREDIIRMAKEAGFHVEDDDYGNPMLVTDSGDLTKFAQLVAAHEREECAQIADDMILYAGQDIATCIRYRT